MSVNTANKRHLGNISRLVGHNVNNKYDYIITGNDLINAWVQMHNDLGYPLKVDSKYRRTIIYNKQGLEKQIQEMIKQCIEETSKDIVGVIMADIVTEFNNITQTANGQFVTGGKGNKQGISSLFTSSLSKGLVNGFFGILDDITSYDNNNRRR